MHFNQRKIQGKNSVETNLTYSAGMFFGENYSKCILICKCIIQEMTFAGADVGGGTPRS